MKIRKGFVSNSSSSSFVVDGTKRTVLDVAFDMVPARDWKERDEELQKKILAKIDSPNADAPIAFHSCNFDTFIMKINNTIFVETCNNHTWEDFINYHHATDEELKLIGQSDRDFDGFRINDLDYFWWPEYEIEAKRFYPDYDFCKNCFCDILQLRTGQKICPKCKKDRSEVGSYSKSTSHY